ncbi:DUF2218 domain-containing protein [Halomonas qinghailakensis]|uniref:DUF2218 domain-containing protein n=2 Tax=Halomonas TaxID=2745 RepID=A0AA46TUF5_9GAMM|nr:MULTISPECIES: DUF2218 domain-containing protein [Halomonas]UYO75737.1 DUF2218 domain-containing protein [Halomonas sp. ZZQ-149]UYV19369.1 DUF2218 domain-containing protein [Halomonas qaidamensis]
MPLSRAEIITSSGERLINRLCKHWAHKLEVEHGEQEAKITFANGTCLMHAEPDRLIVSLETLEENHLDQLEGVVESHLVRMANDEPLEIVWEN